MKRYILIVAAVAIAAVSCSKTYDVKPVSPQPIGFGIWAESLTRTVADPTEPRVEGTNLFRAGDSFAVYGTKTDEDTTPDPTTTTVFDGVAVVATAEGGNPVAATTWDYNNHRFWDLNAESYTFYAVSPTILKENSGFSLTPSTGALSTGDLTFAGDTLDILVADKATILKSAGSGNFNTFGIVPLTFNHAAALVDVKFKKAPALADATVTISAITLDNIVKVASLALATDEYNKTVSTRTTVPNITIASWTPATSSATGSYLPAAGVTPVYGENGTSAIASNNKLTIGETDSTFNPSSPAAPAASTFVFNNLVVVPQEFDDTKNDDVSQKLTFTYQITVDGDTNEYPAKLWLCDFDADNDATEGPSDQIGSWEPGKHYIFYVTIDAHDISFSGSIADWSTTVSGYHYLVN